MPSGGPTRYGRGVGCDPSTTQSFPQGRRGETHRIERDVQSERRMCMDLRDSLQGAYLSADRCQYSVTSSPVRLANPPHCHVKSGRPPRSALPRHRLPGRGVYPPPPRLHRAHPSLQERGPVLACLGRGREAIRGGDQKRRRGADLPHPRGREHRLLGAPGLPHVAYVPSTFSPALGRLSWGDFIFGVFLSS